MSAPQTQIKGSVTLASDAGAITTIGNDTGTMSIKGSTINIENEAQVDNSAQITIGATTTTFDSNTTLAGKTTITKLATPLIPIYAYPITGTTQIGFTVRLDVGVDVAIPTALTTLITLPAVSTGRWLISFLMCIKGGGANNIGVNSILYRDTTPLTYSITAVGLTGVNTSNNIVLVNDVTTGTAVYSIRTTCNQAHTTSSSFTATTPAIANAGYLQATRIA